MTAKRSNTPRCGRSGKSAGNRNRPRNSLGERSIAPLFFRELESGYRLRCGGLLGAAAFLVLLLKSFDASRRIHQLLLACIKRMAVGAYFHADVALMGGAGLERVATSADDVQLVVSGMNTGLHW